MIKFEQSQALTSHFESFWSIVSRDRTRFPLCKYLPNSHISQRFTGEPANPQRFQVFLLYLPQVVVPLQDLLKDHQIR